MPLLVDLRNIAFLLKLPSDTDQWKSYSGHQAALKQNRDGFCSCCTGGKARLVVAKERCCLCRVMEK